MIARKRFVSMMFLGTMCLAAADCALLISAKAQSASVEGFRSARFEMTEAQVRASIIADFKLTPAQIVKQINRVDRTPILSVRVPNLLNDGGNAQVQYKLGCASKKLTQVDVIWGAAVDPKATTQSLRTLIAHLRQFYLQERGFDKNRVVLNVATSQPNIMLLFRAEDEKARVVALLGQFKLDPAAEKGKQMLLDQPEGVIMSFVLDARRPDICPGDSTVENPKGSTRTIVRMQREGGTYVVPVLINGVITLNFVVDSGASDISVPADVVATLMRSGTVTASDFLGEKVYVLADGSRLPSHTFRIRSLKVGNRIVENVIGSVAPVQGSLLLGQSFLSRFKSWSIDNTTHNLVLD